MVETQSIQVSVEEAKELIKKNPEAVAQQEAALTKRASAIPVSEAELDEIDREVAEKIRQLREIDVYSDSDKVRTSFAELFDSSQTRKTQAKDIMGSFAQRSYRGMEDSPAFSAISDLREALEKYDPKKFALSTPERLLGFLPMPGGIKRRLKNYANTMKSGAKHIEEIMEGVNGLIEDGVRSRQELQETDRKLLGLAKGLRKQHIILERLDKAIEEYLEELHERDPIKADKIKADVVFKLKQERLDTVTILNTTLLGIDQVRVLQETQEMLDVSCKRLRDSGQLILGVNQLLVFATDGQRKAANFLEQANQSINTLTESTASQIKDHAKTMAEFAENPLAAVDSLDKAFADTFAALDTLKEHERHRTERVQRSIDAMSQRLKTVDARRESERESLQAFGEVVTSMGARSDGMQYSDTQPKPTTTGPKP